MKKKILRHNLCPSIAATKFATKTPWLLSSSRYINNELSTVASCFPEHTITCPLRTTNFSCLISIVRPWTRRHIEIMLQSGETHFWLISLSNIKYRSLIVDRSMTAGLQQSAYDTCLHNNAVILLRSRAVLNPRCTQVWMQSGCTFSKHPWNAPLSIASVTKSRVLSVSLGEGWWTS